MGAAARHNSTGAGARGMPSGQTETGFQPDSSRAVGVTGVAIAGLAGHADQQTAWTARP